jgi:hypothetical protein
VVHSVGYTKKLDSNRNYWIFRHYNAVFHRELLVKHFSQKKLPVLEYPWHSLIFGPCSFSAMFSAW